MARVYIGACTTTRDDNNKLTKHGKEACEPLKQTF